MTIAMAIHDLKSNYKRIAYIRDGTIERIEKNSST
ncbi:hypothetical protein YN1HA_19470 [Sulfurisphaera ohwakuensis]